MARPLGRRPPLLFSRDVLKPLGVCDEQRVGLPLDRREALVVVWADAGRLDREVAVEWRLVAAWAWDGQRHGLVAGGAGCRRVAVRAGWSVSLDRGEALVLRVEQCDQGVAHLGDGRHGLVTARMARMARAMPVTV
jgi:hypothetical protein